MKFCVLFILFLPVLSFAKETDNLTGRYKQLEDSTAILDAEMNKRLAKLVEQANSKDIPCDQPIEIRRLFHKENGPNYMLTGALEGYAEDNDKIAKRKASPKNSIYEGVLKNGFVFNKIDLASTIKVNEQIIGTDKLGHFVDQGYEYYTAYRQRNFDMFETLRSSRGSESINGKNSTGVKSSADLMANYKGILFYHNLTEGNSPYLRCVNGQWTSHRNFSWSEYVDAGWDEGINCNDFFTKENKEAYDKNIQKLEDQAKQNGKSQSYRCPVEPDACVKLYEKNLANEVFLLGSECRKVAKEAKKKGGTGKPGTTGSGAGQPAQR
ncbi:hypothetical protein D3C72_1154610 [compost metagenome]